MSTRSISSGTSRATRRRARWASAQSPQSGFSSSRAPTGGPRWVRRRTSASARLISPRITRARLSPVPERARWERHRSRVDHVDDPSRRRHPVLFELRAVVDALHGGVADRRGIVDDGLAFLCEPDDDQQMPVRALEQKAVELVRRERDRRDERDTGLDELLRLRERVKLGDPPSKPRAPAYATLKGQLPAPL